jgi:hypothetical protein
MVPLPVNNDEVGVPPNTHPALLVSVIGALIMMAPYDTPAHASQMAVAISKSRMRVAMIRQLFRLEFAWSTSFFPQQVINTTPIRTLFFSLQKERGYLP